MGFISEVRIEVLEFSKNHSIEVNLRNFLVLWLDIFPCNSEEVNIILLYFIHHSLPPMQKIRKCIIPAAGFGTRFLPATKAQPKEMLPIVDKPVIQYLVEEAVSAGITDIIIITGRGKRSIEDHFDMSFELEKTLVEKGKIKELAEVEKVSNLARIAYVRQPIPRGDGDALLRARNLIGDEPCLVLFGDDLIRGAKTGAEQLVEAFERTGSPVIALEKVSDKRVSSYGIIESASSEGKIHRVSRFLEKPKPEETASRL